MSEAPQPRNPDYETAVRDSFQRQGLMAHLNAELRAVRPGEVEIGAPFREEVSQQHGYFHAGTIGAIADSAGGYAALTLLPPGVSILSVEYKLNLLTPAKGDAIIAVGRVIRSGRTLSVSSAEVFVEREGRRERCCIMQQTCIALPPSESRPAG